MENNRIAVRVVVRAHGLDETFIHEIREYNLVTLIHENDEEYIDSQELIELERMIRLRRDLNINAEGLDVIHHLLRRIHDLENEAKMLRNRFYPTGSDFLP